MIGNDIIDLQLASVQSDWRRKGFLDKLFSITEKSFIYDSSDPSVAVWRLWSMKESVYKIHVRSSKVRSFNPKHFSCTFKTGTEGIVISNERTYKTKTLSNGDFIHTIATGSDVEQGIFDGLIMKEDQKDLSSLLYKKTLEDLAKRQFLGINDLQLLKNELQVPELFLNGNKLQMSCSLSHHGRYGAYACTS